MNNTVLNFEDIFLTDRVNAAKSFEFTELWTNETTLVSKELSTSIDAHLVKIWWLNCPKDICNKTTSVMHDEL